MLFKVKRIFLRSKNKYKAMIIQKITGPKRNRPSTLKTGMLLKIMSATEFEARSVA